ncbi:MULTISPECIES: DUF6879 family protein [unclassified Streptomyces]|uniref:DUF6879 family protein n=1 Tax=unclassified Streptomyces TaxID=2593676 RepID=UPI002DDAD430|nr:DUF6879 family protein [Streptomyces sp. NBC_01750]WSB01362.1 hypothetical protein OIE54_19830 [Streptomyces sp. NBC_01794]WSD34291.1 hypothetical protein OG966_21840 [Streptomyces sp. NBC_01750]
MSQSVESFAEIVRDVHRSAVHLEMRDSYGVENEADYFAAFRRGEWSEEAEREERRSWLDLVTATVARGVVMRRARIVSVPVSEYIRYEYAGTQMNIDAGEQVRWLERRQAIGIALPANDFWLFDERLVQFNVFDGNGQWVHIDHTEDPAVAQLCTSAFEAVWERGTPHEKFTV